MCATGHLWMTPNAKSETCLEHWRFCVILKSFVCMCLRQLHSFQAGTLQMTTLSHDVKWQDIPKNSKTKIGQNLHAWVRQDSLSDLIESANRKTQSESLDFIKLKAFSYQNISLIGEQKDKLQTEKIQIMHQTKGLCPPFSVLDSKKTFKKNGPNFWRDTSPDTQTENKHIRRASPSQWKSSLNPWRHLNTTIRMAKIK